MLFARGFKPDFERYLPSPNLRRKLGAACAFTIGGIVACASAVALLVAGNEPDPRNALALAPLQTDSHETVITAAATVRMPKDEKPADLAAAPQVPRADGVRPCPTSPAENTAGCDISPALKPSTEQLAVNPPAAAPGVRATIPAVAKVSPPTAAANPPAAANNQPAAMTKPPVANPPAAVVNPPAAVAINAPAAANPPRAAAVPLAGGDAVPEMQPETLGALAAAPPPPRPEAVRAPAKPHKTARQQSGRRYSSYDEPSYHRRPTIYIRPPRFLSLFFR